MISQTSAAIDPQMLKDQRNAILGISTDENAYPEDKRIYPVEPMAEKIMHTNIFTDKYIKYIEGIDPTLVSGLSYTRMLNINLLRQQGDKASIVKTNPMSFISYPKSLDKKRSGYLEQNYNLLSGSYPTAMNDIVLIVDNKNGVEDTILETFGLDHEADSIAFDKII